MANYIYSGGELYHYGVPGMRWRHKKAGYVTGFQAKKRATIAANEARKKSIAESRASGDKGVGSFQRANRKALNAKRQAYGKSMKADLDHNKQLRAEKKAAKKLAKDQKKWDKAYSKNYIKAYNSAADYANSVLIPKINKKYSKIIKSDDWSKDPNYGRYLKEYEKRFNSVLNKKVTELIGERPK